MKLKKVKISSLKPHPDNYQRHPDSQIIELEKSLEQFGQFKNIVVSDGLILAGHGLVEAAKKRGDESIYVYEKNGLTDKQKKSLLVADNATNSLSIPDIESLKMIVDEIGDIPGINDDFMDEFFVDFEETEEEKYTDKVTTPIYEISGECPDIKDLFETSNRDDVVRYIKEIAINDKDIENFLVESSNRLIKFNYSKIADYYSHCKNSKIRDVMEKIALVIIDYEKAIEYGYTKLSEKIKEQYLNEYER